MKKGSLEKIRGDENLVHGISSLINTMTELSRLAGKYSLQHELYQSTGGLGKVRELIGTTRCKKFRRKHRDICLSYEEEWLKICQFLQVELKDVQGDIIAEKSSQPLCSPKPEATSKTK